MSHRALATLLSIVLFLPVLSCGKASPVAPNGTTITLTANPSLIQSSTGTSTITAVVIKPNGSPATTGTQVRFTTDLGTIDPIESTDRNGIAVATLRGDGRFGKATVSASVSASSGGTGGTGGTPPATGPTVAVQIGNAAKSITLQANPPNLPASGGSVRLVALVRDSNGQPLPGAGVNFTTSLGSLRSRGAIVKTDANGQATDTLTASSTDVANQTTISVTANTAGGDGALISSSAFTIQIQNNNLVAAFVANGNGNGGFTVAFSDRSTGETGAVTWNWNFGDGATSTDQNPTHTYSTTLTSAPVTLTVVNSTGTGTQSSQASKTITLPVTSQQ